MAVSERNLTYAEAVQEGLAIAFKPYEISIATPQGLTDPNKVNYFKAIGGGNPMVGMDIVKSNKSLPIEAWQASYPNAKNTSSIELTEKKIQDSLQKQISTIKDKSGRESGQRKASSARLARVTGGLLSGAQSPNLGEVKSVGPMLGAESGLGEEVSLGKKRLM